jgi:hypothetical protein
MVKTTLVFSVLLIALGLVGYFGTGSLHPTALIPAWIGIAMGFGGLLAISPSESRRKLFMHINVSIGVLGLLGSAVEVVRSYVHGTFTDNTEIIAMASKLALTTLLLIYVYLCMRSFIAVRRSGKV